MKLSTTQKKLLFEAYRRNNIEHSTEQGRPIEERWLGLGTDAAYRQMIDSGLMQFHNNHIPPTRCMGWLVLTNLGIKAIKEYESEFKEILDGMKRSGYDRSILANFQLAGGITKK